MSQVPKTYHCRWNWCRQYFFSSEALTDHIAQHINEMQPMKVRDLRALWAAEAGQSFERSFFPELSSTTTASQVPSGSSSSGPSVIPETQPQLVPDDSTTSIPHPLIQELGVTVPPETNMTFTPGSAGEVETQLSLEEPEGSQEQQRSQQEPVVEMSASDLADRDLGEMGQYVQLSPTEEHSFEESSVGMSGSGSGSAPAPADQTESSISSMLPANRSALDAIVPASTVGRETIDSSQSQEEEDDDDEPMLPQPGAATQALYADTDPSPLPTPFVSPAQPRDSTSHLPQFEFPRPAPTSAFGRFFNSVAQTFSASPSRVATPPATSESNSSPNGGFGGFITQAPPPEPSSPSFEQRFPSVAQLLHETPPESQHTSSSGEQSTGFGFATQAPVPTGSGSSQFDSQGGSDGTSGLQNGRLDDGTS